MFSLTIFKNQYDNKTHRRLDFDEFSQFEKMLYKLAERPLASKRDAELISPATYLPDTTRANRNVVEWGGWAAVDVDDHQFEGDLENELRSRYGRYSYVCYSTASSTDDHPKFRLVFPLKTTVKASDIRSFWYALNTELGYIGDRQTKDLSRMYFVPAKYAGANNFIFSNSGDHIDHRELINKHPHAVVNKAKSFFDRLPEALQEQVIQHRKQKADKHYSWTSYKDCPFVSKRQINEYKALSGTGWYAMMYKIMCSTAVRAVEKGYAITSLELAALMKELDAETGNWYENRPLTVEAENAIEFAYKNAGA